MGVSVKVEVNDKTQEYLTKAKKRIAIALSEIKDDIAQQASINSPYDTGDLSRSFLSDSYVDIAEQTAYIGSTKEYSIYQEFGTGEYAVNDNGRKGGWSYQDARGQWHKTIGVKPQRMLYRAIQSKKSQLPYKIKAAMEGTDFGD